MKHVNDEFTLNGNQRGFGQAGKKLLPRDAADFQFGKNIRERRRRIAAETAHNERQAREELGAYGAQRRSELQVVRTRRALSTRRAGYVERFFFNAVTGDDYEIMYQAAFLSLGNAQWRYFKALDFDFCAQQAQDADDQLLSYAR
jgi:hypothetical protein